MRRTRVGVGRAGVRLLQLLLGFRALGFDGRQSRVEGVLSRGGFLPRRFRRRRHRIAFVRGLLRALYGGGVLAFEIRVAPFERVGRRASVLVIRGARVRQLREGIRFHLKLRFERDGALALDLQRELQLLDLARIVLGVAHVAGRLLRRRELAFERRARLGQLRDRFTLTRELGVERRAALALMAERAIHFFEGVARAGARGQRLLKRRLRALQLAQRARGGLALLAERSLLVFDFVAEPGGGLALSLEHLARLVEIVLQRLDSGALRFERALRVGGGCGRAILGIQLCFERRARRGRFGFRRRHARQLEHEILERRARIGMRERALERRETRIELRPQRV